MFSAAGDGDYDSFNDEIIFGDDDFRDSGDERKQNGNDFYAYAGVGRGGFGSPQFKTGNEVNKRNSRQSKLRKTVIEKSNPVKVQDESVEDFRMAVMRGNLDMIIHYIEKGIPVDTLLKSGWSCLMYSANCASKHIVKELLDRGADPYFMKDQYTVLMAACGSIRKEDDINICVELLLAAGADPHLHDKYNMTALMYAAKEGRKVVVKMLIDKQVNVNMQDSRCYTALTWAASRGHMSIIEYLMEHDADPGKTSIHGQTAKDVALNEGHLKIVEFLGGDVSFKDSIPVNILGEIPAFPAHDNSYNKNVIKDTPTNTETPKSYIKYGEMELFLTGLELSHLIPIFTEHQITFADFLRMTDLDLEKTGIKQVGVRKKILDAIREVHKKDWETSSLTSVQYNKHISCPEAIAMVANIHKHVMYIRSTICYIHDQIRSQPKLLTSGQDGTAVDQLLKHTSDSGLATQQLFENLQGLQTQLVEFSDYKPNDLIGDSTSDRPFAQTITNKSKRKSRRKLRRLAYVIALSAVVGVCIWKKGEILTYLQRTEKYFTL